MKISAAYYTARGGRKHNEDAASLLESGKAVLGIIADGLGGHACGEIASRLAINTVTARLGQEPLSASVLREAIEAANEAILEDKRCQTMKSTIAVVWFDEANALAATVGDTRVYQFRDRRIVFQSKDHSVTQLEVMAGELDEKDIRGNKNRNRLIRALGAKDEVKADVTTLDAKPEDAFLLCSDGFWEHIWEAEMISLLDKTDDATQWLDGMRSMVEARITEKSDNHTAIAIIIKG